MTSIIIIIIAAFQKVWFKSKLFPQAVKQTGLMFPAKPGNAEYLVLAGFPYPFVDLESAYKPRTLSLVGKGMVSTAKTN